MLDDKVFMHRIMMIMLVDWFILNVFKKVAIFVMFRLFSDGNWFVIIFNMDKVIISEGTSDMITEYARFEAWRRVFSSKNCLNTFLIIILFKYIRFLLKVNNIGKFIQLLLFKLMLYNN